MLTVYKGAVDEIERITSALRGSKQAPNWQNEVQTITAFNKGDVLIRRVISDLWLKKNDVEHYVSIKTVQPNLDQTEVAKKDMLLVKAANSQHQAYLALYYNPNGSARSDYKHSPPKKIFDMHNDSCVLIGKDYWEFLGGPDTYQSLLDTFAEAGKETKTMLLNF